MDYVHCTYSSINNGFQRIANLQNFQIYLPEEIGIAKIEEIKWAIKKKDAFMVFEV